MGRHQKWPRFCLLSFNTTPKRHQNTVSPVLAQQTCPVQKHWTCCPRRNLGVLWDAGGPPFAQVPNNACFCLVLSSSSFSAATSFLEGDNSAMSRGQFSLCSSSPTWNADKLQLFPSWTWETKGCGPNKRAAHKTKG